MHTINWRGNDGRCTPDAGTMEEAQCGICDANMNVKRNVLGATSFAESMSGKEHRHDRFVCPRTGEDWHKKIYRLKIEVYIAETNDTHNKDKIKKAAEAEIIKLLEANL